MTAFWFKEGHIGPKVDSEQVGQGIPGPQSMGEKGHRLWQALPGGPLGSAALGEGLSEIWPDQAL